MGHRLTGRETYLAARVLDALVREDYGGLAGRVTHARTGVVLPTPAGRPVPLVAGGLYQDFVVAPGEPLRLAEVLDVLAAVADPADRPGVEAFTGECHAALRALDLLDRHGSGVLARLSAAPAPGPGRFPEPGPEPPAWGGPGPGPRAGAGPGAPAGAQTGSGPGPEPGLWSGPGPGPSVSAGPGVPAGVGAGFAPAAEPGLWAGPRPDSWSEIVYYDTLAAFRDHPVYPTARCRFGLSDGDALAYAPEFAPRFRLRWAAVPSGRVVRAGAAPPWWPSAADVGLGGPGTSRGPGAAGGQVLFPVHPLAVPVVAAIPGVVVAPGPYLTARPTLSMRTVEVAAPGRPHLKLPLPTSTLGLRNRRSIKPGTLRDGALAELLLREIAAREPDLRVVLADEQTYAHAGHEYLAWLLRRYPADGEIVSVAALPARPGGARSVAHDLADRHYDGDVRRLLAEYLRLLLRWNVRLFVRYGVALEAHQQNLALVLGHGRLGLLVKDNDGLLVSPTALRAAGLGVPPFGDDRLLTGDPHALADVFVTITLHLAAAAVAFGVLGTSGGRLVRDALAAALAEHGEHPMARLLRARTLDAARLVGKAMVTAATLTDKSRTGARDVNKYYGITGPNYLRHPPRTLSRGISPTWTT